LRRKVASTKGFRVEQGEYRRLTQNTCEDLFLWSLSFSAT
jgi:hypothetical protein